MKITREFLIGLGFTVLLHDDIDGRHHWFVADNKPLNIRVAINLNQYSKTGFSYLTLEGLEYKQRVYRGNATQEFLKTLIELNKK